MNDSTTVLVVDDSRVSRLMARQFILSKNAGMLIEEAANGEEALEKARSVTPALILMDVNMPGMGGLAAAELLRRQFPHAHISLLTANVQDATRKRAQDMGVAFMEKPITEARIHQLMSVLDL